MTSSTSIPDKSRASVVGVGLAACATCADPTPTAAALSARPDR